MVNRVSSYFPEVLMFHFPSELEIGNLPFFVCKIFKLSARKVIADGCCSYL